MLDNRLSIFADLLLAHSVELEPNQKVMIEMIGPTTELGSILIDKVYEMGGLPFYTIKSTELTGKIIHKCCGKQLNKMAECELKLLEDIDCYISLRAMDNIYEWSSLPTEKLLLYQNMYMGPVHYQYRIPNTKWVSVRYPTVSMAQMAGMNTAEFFNYFFDVTCINYPLLYQAMVPLKDKLENTKKVKLFGKGTELTFLLDQIPVIVCAGKNNIPDGEVYTAPLRESVSGYITFNTPSVYQGNYFSDVFLRFEEGKIVDTNANIAPTLEQILNIDGGARYVGEFGIGCNPFVTRPINDTMFNEKMLASIHIALGNSYKNAFNGNHSAIHWDLVNNMHPDYGGGEVWFDDELIIKDAQFVADGLELLNSNKNNFRWRG